MADCIMTTCVGYKPDQVFCFLKSCRNVFSGEIVAITRDLPADTVDLLKKFGVRTFALTAEPPDFVLVAERFRAYRELLTRGVVQCERVLFSDLSDVLFQSDPFEFDPGDYRVKLFLEDLQVKNDKANSEWLRHTHGSGTVAEMADHWVSCAGVTLASYEGAVQYLDKLVAEYDAFLDRSRKAGIVLPYRWGYDQAIHNYLIHTKALGGCVLVPNGAGEVQHMYHQAEFTFSSRGQMLNLNKKVCPILHHTHRHPEFLPVLLKANKVVHSAEVSFKVSMPP